MEWAEHFASQLASGTQFDSISAGAEGVTVTEAYTIQQQLVDLLDEAVAGYKAALTAPAAQQAMNIDEAITGVLFASGNFPQGPLHLTRPSVLETEIGFTAAQAITEPVSAAEVFDQMSTCQAMIEVASPNLTGRPNGIDLIATNAASYGYICGTPMAIPTELDSLSIELHHIEDGSDNLLHTGTPGDVMQGQASALAWLVNQTLSLGYTIAAGHLFLTGSIGAMHPAQPGAYKASYGSLGEITFSI